MNASMKKRMIVVGGIVVIVIIVLLAVLGSSMNAQVVSVADASSGNYAGKKVQVSGKVVDNSYSVDGKGVLTFDIADENDTAQATTVHVSYDKGVSATFGNGVTAICTGRMDGTTLTCTELVTKCPSKYENASTALTVSQLLGYDSQTMIGKTVKVSGAVKSLGNATQEIRFVLVDASDSAQQLSVVFQGALSEQIADGSKVVVTGALENASGKFLASEVSLEG